MNRERILQLIDNREQIHLTVVDTVTSTNTLLRQQGAEGAPEGTLLSASHQTEGRGRLGRRFESPSGTGLYCSVLLRPDKPVSESLVITMKAAVAVSLAIADCMQVMPRIKWVNDLYLNNRKVCGILAESVLCPGSDRIDYTVLGIGLNIEPPDGGFSSELADIAGTLYNRGEAPADAAEQLLAAICNRFFPLYRSDSRDFMTIYRQNSYLADRHIFIQDDVTDDTSLREAIARSVTEDGRLEVELPDGTREYLSSGDVRIRIPR